MIYFFAKSSKKTDLRLRFSSNSHQKFSEFYPEKEKSVQKTTPHFCKIGGRRKKGRFLGPLWRAKIEMGVPKKPFRRKSRPRTPVFPPFGAEKYRNRRKSRNRRFTSTRTPFSRVRGSRKGTPGAPQIAKHGVRSAPKPLRGRFREFASRRRFSRKSRNGPGGRKRKKVPKKRGQPPDPRPDRRSPRGRREGGEGQALRVRQGLPRVLY